MSTGLKPTSFAATDIGVTRDTNEDRFLCDDSLKLYVVADGMGGHACGDIAAELAVDAVAEFVRSGEKMLASSIDPKDDVAFRTELVEAAVEHAAAAVHHARNNQPGCEDMGTTLTLLLLVDQDAFIAHIGDSRAYRIRKGQVERLTNDHTLQATLVADGVAPETISDRYGHMLVRSIGGDPSPKVDVRVETLRTGDRFLLCTDGLSNQFTDEELAVMVDEEQTLETIVENLIYVGKLLGGRDNLTAVLVETKSQATPESPCPLVDHVAQWFHRAIHMMD
ncbi:PP2C family protein-serine/threonine phosphatase [Aporhodopirellula aestuarii]|uniref:Protein phosphatase 2C domain-containing protein n=1 Tax=Aporhodopirellula aestuarii TaxID=2950107 RepID=A0ABT0UB20_9BACT|nr:protein phosphatase 2C domain-containing protein [Aporhodopirellula aestuarii]MCM2374103.1 protein phosphatase 2C domain-containing protein [Aporhodopirellula aestuarii]